jgi:hypothetical protein
MQTVRFNPFGQIHKGLRALLYNTALHLQHTDFSSAEEIAAAVERVQLVNRLFEHHAHVEDSQIFPMIEAYEPALVADFESQHQKDHELSEALEACLHRFTETNSTEQNIFAGNELQQNFNAFLAFNVEHMKQEETLVNQCLWRYYSDADLLKKVQEISSSIPPEQNRHFVYWMLKGMATHEIIQWYNAVRLSAPGPVFRFFCELAEEALPLQKWNAVQEALQEEALLA